MNKIAGWLRRTFAWLLHHGKDYFIHYLAIATIAFLVATFKAFRDDEKLSYYLKNAIEWVTPITIAVQALLLGFLIYYIVTQRRRLNKLESNEATLAAFGVRAFSNHDTPASKRADWELISADISTASQNESPLWILGATGKDTFSDPGAPLHKTLKEYQGPIKVLLLRPNSFGFSHRVNQIRTNPGHYINDIVCSINFCSELKRAGKPIELKLYDTMPIWKMLMTPQVLWVQHYSSECHVDNTPAYGFALGLKKATILNGFKSVFEKRWSQDGSTSVDLDRFESKNWQSFCGS